MLCLRKVVNSNVGQFWAKNVEISLGPLIDTKKALHVQPEVIEALN